MIVIWRQEIWNLLRPEKPVSRVKSERGRGGATAVIGTAVVTQLCYGFFDTREKGMGKRHRPQGFHRGLYAVLSRTVRTPPSRRSFWG
eukprot:246734-Chlamydomonas_euryale.AAC.1